MVKAVAGKLAGYETTFITRAEMGDDEHVDSGRAALYVQLFGAEAPI